MGQNALPLLASGLLFVAALLAAGSLRQVWDRVAARYVADLAPTITALSIDQKLVDRSLRWWGIALVATPLVLGLVLRMWPLAVAAVGLVYFAPRLWLAHLIRRRRLQIRDQLVGATVSLANTARAGMSLAQGLENVARESPQPLASELGRMVADYRFGLPLAQALRKAKDRLQVDSFTLFSSAMLACLDRGGRITEALDRISHSLQENQRVERKLEAETAAGRKVVRFLAAFPLFFLALFAVIYPDGMQYLFGTVAGQIVLAVVVLLVAASVRWSNKILTLDV
jgi:tight adherence protein B